jgi:cardiolipin synthase
VNANGTSTSRRRAGFLTGYLLIDSISQKHSKSQVNYDFSFRIWPLSCLPMAVLLKSVSTPGLTSSFRWLKTGEEALASMLSCITSATRSIRLETYIFHEGPVANDFREALTVAAQRGLKVQVLVDSMGSIGLADAFWDSFRQAGGQFAWFNPLTLGRWSCRDHRKILVCDGEIAFIGGFNIADEYRGDGVSSGWRDLGLEITGPLAKELAESFDTFFSRANLVHKRLQTLLPAREQVALGQNWKLLLSGPGLLRDGLKRSLAQDLKSARSVKIICAYFLPTWRLRKSILSVARRGGSVQLILAGKSDVALSQLASRRLYRTFLRAGVEIFEYQPQILHAKLFIIDNIVYAGSANMDVRSLRINYELLVRISEPALAAEAREMFGRDLVHCRRIERLTWKKSRNFWAKLKENWAYFILARVDPYIARRQLKYLR